MEVSVKRELTVILLFIYYGAFAHYKFLIY